MLMWERISAPRLRAIIAEILTCRTSRSCTGNQQTHDKLHGMSSALSAGGKSHIRDIKLTPTTTSLSSPESRSIWRVSLWETPLFSLASMAAVTIS